MDHAIALLSGAQDAASHFALVASPNIPDPGNGSAPPGVGSAFESVMGWAKWICLGIAVLGIMAIGAMIAVGSRRGEGGEKVGALGWALAGVCIIAGAVSLVGFLVTAGEEEEAASGASLERSPVAVEQVYING